MKKNYFVLTQESFRIPETIILYNCGYLLTYLLDLSENVSIIVMYRFVKIFFIASCSHVIKQYYKD